MFQTTILEKIKHTFHVQQSFSENRSGYEIMWKKNCSVGQATDDNVALAHCMLDN
jgi:hypothetical protein